MKHYLLTNLLTGAMLLSSMGLSAQTLQRATEARVPAEAREVPLELKDAKARKKAKLPIRTNASGLKKAMSKTPAVYKAPSFAGDASVDLRGTIIYSSDPDEILGMYSIPTTASGEFELLGEGVNASLGGACVDGKYYAFWQKAINEYYAVPYMDTWDPSDWTLLDRNSDIGSDLFGSCMTYDATTGLVWGCFYDYWGEAFEFGAMNVASYSRTTVSALDTPWNSIAAAADGTLYVITRQGTLNTVDKTTGELTLIGQLPVTPKYTTGATIDPKSGVMYWAVSTDTEAALYAVNTTDATAEKVCDFPNSYEVTGLYIPSALAADKAPGAVTGLTLNFPNGTMSGSVDFTAPATTFDGEAGSGDLTYYVLVNGVEKATGTTTFGANVSVPMTIETAGNASFTVYVSNAAGNGPKSNASMFVGNGTPEEPYVEISHSAYTQTMSIFWDPVGYSIDGGYIDEAEVTYTLTRYPGAVELLKDTHETEYSETIAIPESPVGYYYTVTANFRGLTATGKSNKIVLGEIVPPYQNLFDTEEEANVFKVTDSNWDDRTWNWHPGRWTNYFTEEGGGQCDDWLLTPAIRLEAGKTYAVTFTADNEGRSFPERLEAKWGDKATARGMTNVLLEPTVLDTGNDVVFNCIIQPEADGLYYVGFHAISDENSYYLHLNDFAIGAPVSNAAPAEIADLKVIPDYTGELTAEIAFTAPATDIAGQALTAIDKIEITRDGTLVHTIEPATPGQKYSWTDELETVGRYAYTVTATNAYGTSTPVTVTNYVGLEAPGPVTNVVMTEDEPGVVTISWDDPETDLNGNELDLEQVTYAIHDGENLLAQDITGTSVTFRAVPEGERAFKQFIVFSINRVGGSMTMTDLQCLGERIYLPYNESFAGGELTYPMAVTESELDGTWGLGRDGGVRDFTSADGDNGYAYMNAATTYSTASMLSPKVALGDAEDPVLSLYVYKVTSASGTYNENTLEILVNDGSGFKTLHTQEIGALTQDGWNRLTLPLTEYKGKIITLKLKAVGITHTYNLIDGLKVYNRLANDLAATGISAPAKATIGVPFSLNVQVENFGTEPSGEYTVTVYKNGTEHKSVQYASLAVGDRVLNEIECTLNPADDPEENYFYATIVSDSDLDDGNNDTEDAVVALRLTALPAPTDLAKNVTANGLELTWTAPDLANVAAQEMTEDFEEAEPFLDTYGDWTFVDRDNYVSGAITGLEIPNHPLGEVVSSFYVFDSNLPGSNSSLAGHSGHQYLIAMYRYDAGKNDDWAISPRLDGSAQTISFFAKSYDGEYAETIEVLYSTTDTDPDNFIVVKEAGEVPTSWTEYTVELPEGAKYFAIHSMGEDTFLLMVDDVTFTPLPVTEGLELLGYNVYANAQRVNEGPVAETFWSGEIPAATTSYAVSALYNKGESPASNVVRHSSVDNIALSGATVRAENRTIVVENAAGQQIRVYNTEGIAIAAISGQDSARIAVAPGIYLVRIGSQTTKLIVR